MAKFKSATDTGVTVHTQIMSIRIDAGDTYDTTDDREIEVLRGASGVVEVKTSTPKKK